MMGYEKAPLLRRLEKRNWAILGGMTALSLALLPFSGFLGVIIGGLLSILNYYGLYGVVRRVVAQPAAKARGIMLLWHTVRLASVGAVLYLVISNQWVDIVPLLMGLSVVVISILFTTIRDYRRILLEV